MKYTQIVKAEFLQRPNRFVALCRVHGEDVKVHVKNTGRCRELLIPGCTVYLEDFAGRMGTRKLQYSLIAVEKVAANEAGFVKEADFAIEAGSTREADSIFRAGDNRSVLINMDSQAPNQVVEEALKNRTIVLPETSSLAMIKREQKFAHSRFDFYVAGEDGQEGYVEVKGVTLEEDGIVRFPDAPTERGRRHLEELIAAKEQGYMAYVVFVVQTEKALWMEPNDSTHKAFGDTLRKAKNAGVNVLAYTCSVKPDTLEIGEPLEVRL